MLDKRCPFCMSSPSSHWNDDETIYIMECENCKSKGITIKCEDKDPKKAQLLWNTRAYDCYIMKNIDIIKEVLNEDYVFFSKPEEHQEIIDVLRLDDKNDGYFIMPNLDILVCEDGHVKKLLQYLNIYTENSDFTEVSDICLKIGVIRISVMSDCLMVAIPQKYKRAQIDKTIEVLCQKNLKTLKSYYFYQLCQDTNKYEQYNNLNELIIKLEEVR